MPIKLVPQRGAIVGQHQGDIPPTVRSRYEHRFVRAIGDYERVDAMVRRGMTIASISRATGIPRSTINNWRRRGRPGAARQREPWSLADPAAYAYLLGLYLGDGHITSVRSPFLRLYLDDGYPTIIRDAHEALATVFGKPVGAYRYSQRGQLVILQISTPALLDAFPQHGPGVKHLRPIKLEPWQREITQAHARELIRGLIHSDGCRCVNRFKTKLPSGRVAEYEYPRYFFSNLSADIRGLFCEYCDRLGIRWTQANHRNISISHRRSVALLDEFVGPKA